MKEKLYNLSYLRVLGCIAVVLLHISASETLLYKDKLSTGQMFAATAAYNLMMWAVPCFLMVSGALLLPPDKKIPTDRIFRVYVRRMLLSLIIFSLIFRIFDIIMDGEAFTVKSVLGTGFYEIYTGSGWSHLWYLYLLVGIYLVLPFIRMITAKAEDREIRMLLLVLVCFGSLLPITRIWGAASAFYIPVATIYPFYFISGYAIHHKKIQIGRAASLLLFATGSIGMAVFSWISVNGVLSSTANLLNYSSVFVVMQAVGMFSLFDGMRFEGGNAVSKLLTDIDAASFGVYLFHMMLVRYVLRYKGVDLFAYGGAGVTIAVYAAFVTGVFAVSYIVIALLKRIPVVKRLGIL